MFAEDCKQEWFDLLGPTGCLRGPCLRANTLELSNTVGENPWEARRPEWRGGAFEPSRIVCEPDARLARGFAHFHSAVCPDRRKGRASQSQRREATQASVHPHGCPGLGSGGGFPSADGLSGRGVAAYRES